MARMDSLSFRVRTMSWNGERPTDQTLLDKHISSLSASGRWSNVIHFPLSFRLGLQTDTNPQQTSSELTMSLCGQETTCILVVQYKILYLQLISQSALTKQTNPTGNINH